MALGGWRDVLVLERGELTGGSTFHSAGLVGQRLTPEAIDATAELAAGPSKPLDNTDFTHPYRKKMTRVFVARALRRLAGLPEVAGA